ncbi:hypothetical protein ERJ75_001614400 [Trypanosoma vivax]|uniref:Template-activating factor I n=1 Tax=Trypanosoma vivax (strain Y486) TaxID=1055687 RepID=G0TTH0_TRYVY|nr:hypothetical protein TRVL_07318 [Trypanosoma vivax]KAH8605736.1 hypothetical protein ERJ75_001614400 [Trypanosoma vivax]CCC47251.1 conserved hypothetical protein [Trypanosoma vivax Y486]
MSVLPKDVAVALEACNERIRSIEEEKQSALEKMRIDYRLKIESLFGKRQEYLDQIDGFWSSVLASASSPLKDFFNGTIDPKIVRAVTKLHVWTCVKDGSLCRCVSVTFRQNMFVEQGTYSRELNSDLHTISIEPIKWKPGTERARQDSVFRFLSEEMKEKELIEDILDAFDTVFQDPLLVLEEGEE